MKALVTGATGFLGGTLARKLKSLGHRVTGSGRDEAKGAQLQADGISFFKADLDDVVAARAMVAGQDWVFHCGALSAAWGRDEAFYRANVTGTQVMVDAALEAKVKRFVHISSPSICMDDCDRLGIKESDVLPAEPINEYAWSKRLAEAEVQRAVQQGLHAVLLRPQAVFGPGDTALFPRILRVAAKGRFPRIGGANSVDVTYVDNVVDACLQAARSRKAKPGSIYNISNGEPQAIDGMLDGIFARLNLNVRRFELPLEAALMMASGLEAMHRLVVPDREPLMTKYGVLVLARSRTLDISRARKDLGYKPKVSVAEGLERFARHWEAQSA